MLRNAHGRGVELDDLQDPFKPKPFCDSMKLRYNLLVKQNKSYSFLSYFLKSRLLCSAVVKPNGNHPL